MDPGRSARASPPSELVVALGSTLPEFLAIAANTSIVVIFIRVRLDISLS
jgi:hypothetical protein